MFRGAVIGVVFLGCIYVAGFSYKVGFFSAITSEVSWMRLVEVDYLFSGVYALIDIFRIHVVMLILVFVSAMTYLDRIFIMAKKEAVGVLLSKLEREVSVCIAYAVTAAMAYMFFWIVLVYASDGLESIMALGKKEAYKFLESDRSDRLCNYETDECLQGKLLYTNATSYIFFSVPEGMSVEDGRTVITDQRHSEASVGWSEAGLENFRNYKEKNEG